MMWEQKARMLYEMTFHAQVDAYDAGSAPSTHPHTSLREDELLEACHESYVRGFGLRMNNVHTAGGNHREAPYTVEDLEHDVELVLRGGTPERCANWPVFSTGGLDEEGR